MSILLKLEPVQYQPFFTIVSELDEYNEICFIMRGIIDIGFEINKKQKFVIKKENGCVIGAFGISYHKRSHYIYRTNKHYAQGYFVRKEDWLDILQKNPTLIHNLLQNILFDYIMNIRVKAQFGRKKLL